MKTATYLLAVAAFLVAPSLSATQSPVVSGIQASTDELSPEVQWYVGRGDQLTDEAARVGDLEVEALSIYYAAWLNGKAGRGTEMAARAARLEGLLRSQYIPVALRDRLSGWLKTSAEVAAAR